MPKMSVEEIQSGLAQFYGTEGYHRLSPFHGPLVVTDGVAWLCEKAECFWLLDEIAMAQPKCMKDRMLREHQFWTLRVNPDKSATLICERDSGNVFSTKEIPFSDFPMAEVKIWVEPGERYLVALLPSEH